jgi:hypothetical protein
METPLPPYSPVPPQEQISNPLAIAAGSCGIGSIGVIVFGVALTASIPSVAMICNGLGVIACLVGLVLGIVALVQINHNPGQKGKGWAITGIVIGGITICVGPVVVISILMILGPIIGNVFTKINSSLMVP